MCERFCRTASNETKPKHKLRNSMNTWNKRSKGDQEMERDHGDRAPEDMVEHEFWDDTNLQKDGDLVRGLLDF